MQDRRDFFENLVYETTDEKRFTQQSPVMPDVWIRYGMNPGKRQELLLVPDRHFAPADLTRKLKKRLKTDSGNGLTNLFRDQENHGSVGVAHNQNTVVATLWFDELVRSVLPLSEWWRESIAGIHGRKDTDRLHRWLDSKEKLVDEIVNAWSENDKSSIFSTDFLWLARVAGLLALISTDKNRVMFDEGSEIEQVDFLRDLRKEQQPQLAAAFVDILKGIEPVYFGSSNYPLYSVNRNRRTTPALHNSVSSVKADASTRVFQVRGEGIRWAVIDSGIDARHIAFRKRDEGIPRPEAFGRQRRRRRAESANGSFANNTRVVATYDFIHIRELLGAEPEDVDQLPRDTFPILRNPEMRKRLREFLEDYDSGMIDWQRLEPFIRIEHTPKVYSPPVHRHGTHVAGIIGADWRTSDKNVKLPSPREDLFGICPAIELYDLRVMGDDGSGDEFAIMSAMQYVRALNNRKDFVAIHGVNLSLSVWHDVANYACGRTPICEEAERLVGNGIVVVAAAGNSGRARYLTPSNEIDEGFRTVSITDPGNAESVITVGSTHRRDAHTYGVSYFSSRGPTGDGRLKPDLVAPGEKIRSTIPGNSDDRMDGTSMAAPHVSGAAALVMARYFELVGQPRKIKETLCTSATDLGRERYFQGAGLLDILRAMQAI